ncbi:ATP-dependent zinc metalloprotease FTSH 12, chloroplastic [Vitis vinifera]|uniref:ATP-dependent zinc metalloprotease FTSH 12, chloroplastic n=1 Tax=Vitis vinifera TaxID=29760 RepID=A0A438DQU0_VITVI|nr:ATP-dependent zinc metalloprotease FTSH 12, chloroplastic [Vitis vinifera]
MQMVVAHGGRCAERVVFGDEITDGGRDDLRKDYERSVVSLLLQEQETDFHNPQGPYGKDYVGSFSIYKSSVYIQEKRLSYLLFVQIAREMVISPANSRLGLTALTKRVGLMDRPDSPDGELIKYMWDDPFVIPANMTLEVSELFSRELTRVCIISSIHIWVCSI